MLEEPDVTALPVRTPHVSSRTEAWMAWEAAIAAKAKTKRKKSPHAKEFEQAMDRIYNGRVKYFIGGTRPNRFEVMMFLVGGGTEWVSARNLGWVNAKKYLIHPDYDVFVKRQQHFMNEETRDPQTGVWRTRLSLEDRIFYEGFYEWEEGYVAPPPYVPRTPEEIEEEERRLKLERSRRIYTRIMSMYEMFLQEPATREALVEGGPLLRTMFLIGENDYMGELAFRIYAHTLMQCDSELHITSAYDIVARILGYDDFDEVRVIRHQFDDRLPNRRRITPTNQQENAV